MVMIAVALVDGRNVQNIASNMCKVYMIRLHNSVFFVSLLYRPTSHLAYGHELVPDVENSQCPENHLVCCKSMIPVAGFCMSKSFSEYFVRRGKLRLGIPEFNRVVAEWAKLQATHPDATLANLIVTIQNNGLSSLSG